MSDLTAIILTKDESSNIKECINSIKNITKRIVVVDSGSSDNTVEIAKDLGADVYFNEFEYYAQQFNWGINNTDINTKWILRIDADERFTDALCIEVNDLLTKYQDNDLVNGITMEAWLYFLGKRLKYGASKKRKLMIFKRGIGEIENRKRDAHSILSFGKSVTTGERFIHHDFKDVDNFVSKYNYYATREMEDYIDFKKGNASKINTDEKIIKTRKNKFGIYYRAPKYIRAKLWYIYNYYLRLGFLDGVEGYIFHSLECNWYRFLVDVKIYENTKN